MIIVIDIGNSNICIGGYRGDELAFDFRVNSDGTATVDEYSLMILPKLSESGVLIDDIEAVVISSVVLLITPIIVEFVKKHLKKEAYLVKDIFPYKMIPNIKDPDYIGTDIVSDIVGAKMKYSTPAIVVDMGTASTFNTISENGDFIGCIIAPGARLFSEQLHNSTSLLPQVPLSVPTQVLGTDTVTAIRSGVYYGYLDLVNGLLTRILKEKFDGRELEVNIIFTGGLSSVFVGDIKYPVIHEPYLTLHGLKYIYDISKV